MRETLGLPQSKVVFSSPPHVEKNGSYWFKEAKRKSEDEEFLKCPWKGCEGDMLDGPSGGMSINVKCNTCERKWNLTEAMGSMERI
jgi:hypothetical protein